MGMKVFEEDVKEFRLVYDDVHGDGYAFPCDKNGAILWDQIPCPEAVKKNLAVCKAHPEKWVKAGEVVTLIKRHRYGVCPHCGRRVLLCGEGYYGAFGCDCGHWYNRFGQELIPPKFWYEDHDDDWYADRDDDWYDYSDEDEDWESESEWYEQLYKWSINAL